MANTTTTQVPAAINYFYDRALLERIVPLFLYNRYGQVRDIPQNATASIKFRRYGTLSAQLTPLSEGVTPTGSQLSITDVTATVSQYGDFVTLTDFLEFTTLDPVLVETADILGQEAGDTLDQLCRDIITAGTSVLYADGHTQRVDVDSADVLTATEIKKAVRTLKANNAKKVTSMINPTTGYNTTPVNAAFVGIVHPNTTYDLKNATGWVAVESYPSQSNVMDGEVGKVDEVRFVESTNAKVFAGAGASAIDIYATLILGRDAYGVTRISSEAIRNIIKPLGSAGTADPLDQRATSGWKATFVAVILQNLWMERIEHAVS